MLIKDLRTDADGNQMIVVRPEYPISMNGMVVLDVPPAVEDTDIVTLGDVKNQFEQLGDTAKKVYLDEHTGFYEANAGEKIYTHSKCVATTIKLPEIAKTALGDMVSIVGGGGAGGWKIALQENVEIHHGNNFTSRGRGGFLKSTTPYTAVRMSCAEKLEDVTRYVVESASTELQYI